MEKSIIYCCHNILNGKKYIGQTKNSLEYRMKKHHSDSRNNRYSHIKFYRAINKYGVDNFIWGIIEEVDSSIVNEREIYWIDYYNSCYEGYNTTLGGEGRKDPNNGRIFTLIDPEGNIVTHKNIKKFCEENNLTRRKITKVLGGKQKSHKGYRLPNYQEQKHKNYRTKEFTIMSPIGELITDKNIKKFCEESNLNYKKVLMVLSGKKKSYKGYRLPSN